MSADEVKDTGDDPSPVATGRVPACNGYVTGHAEVLLQIQRDGIVDSNAVVPQAPPSVDLGGGSQELGEVGVDDGNDRSLRYQGLGTYATYKHGHRASRSRS